MMIDKKYQTKERIKNITILERILLWMKKKSMN